MTAATDTSVEIADYVRIALNEKFEFDVHISPLIVLFMAVIALGLIFKSFISSGRFRNFEIDQAEFGLGDQKITLKPNDLDRTVAYRIWVELSTRKIGLPIDLKDDVIEEIYNSWYEFFSITRELIKDVPVSRVRQASTRKIINLSIEVLNSGLRPHLTRWQARFRRWYSYQLEFDREAALHPQDIQQNFPDYQELVADMMIINERLMAYRRKMLALVTQ
jgi:hypothetical protein